MSANYDPTLVINPPRDRARQLLGDTGEDPAGVFLLQDETILALLALFPFSEAVAELAEGLATRFAQQPDEYNDEGGTKVSWKKRVDQWNLLAMTRRSGDQREEITYTGVQFATVQQADPTPPPKPCDRVDANGNPIPYGTPGLRF